MPKKDQKKDVGKALKKDGKKRKKRMKKKDAKKTQNKDIENMQEVGLLLYFCFTLFLN